MQYKSTTECSYSSMTKKIAYICDNEYKYFLDKENVVGIGCGYKVKNGFRISDLCIQVFVSRKFLKEKVLSNNLIPLTYKGIKTDVIESGFFTSASLTDRIRPGLGGYSISTSINESLNYYGTAGCLVTNGVLRFILSTNHTLVNDNKLPLQTPIVQPALKYHGACPGDIIARLHKFMPLRFIEGERSPINLSDCAIALVSNPDIFSPQIAFIGKLKGIKSPKLNANVQKVGSITGFTQGTITSINATFTSINLDGSRCLFQKQIFTTKMNEPGDSGAILVNNHKYALGLLVGGAANLTIFCRMDTVLDQLDVKIVT